MGHKAALCAVFLTAFVSSARAEEKRCFDFSRKVVTALREAPKKEGEDAIESGRKADGAGWAAIRGQISKPLEKVLAQLLDRETTRDPAVAEMKVDLVEAPNYLAYHRVKNLLKPFLFIEVRWVEEWVYAIAEGTREAPQTVVISYEKTEGSSFIQHHCGNIVLRRVSTGTEMSQYEESRITGQSEKDRVVGLTGLLARLRR